MDIHRYFPDDERLKEVFVEVTLPSSTGDTRPAIIFWDNGGDWYRHKDTGRLGLVEQLVQPSPLSDGPTPLYRHRTENPTDQIYQASLGFFDRKQRDLIMDLADIVSFSQTSTGNDSTSVVWLRSLLYCILQRKMISREKFDEIVRDALLPEHQNE